MSLHDKLYTGCVCINEGNPKSILWSYYYCIHCLPRSQTSHRLHTKILVFQPLIMVNLCSCSSLKTKSGKLNETHRQFSELNGKSYVNVKNVRKRSREFTASQQQIYITGQTTHIFLTNYLHKHNS